MAFVTQNELTGQGFPCNFSSAFSLANFLIRGLNCTVVASKRRLQLSTVEILINGNDQNFKNNGVMSKLRGSKKNFTDLLAP